MLFAKSKQPYQQDLWINISIEQAKKEHAEES